MKFNIKVLSIIVNGVNERESIYGFAGAFHDIQQPPFC